MKNLIVCSLIIMTAAVIGDGLPAALAQTSADRPQGARPEGPAAASNLKPAAPVCCKRGSRTWRTTKPACRRAQGKPVANALCGVGRQSRTKRPLGARPGGPTASPNMKRGVPICCRKGAKKWMTVLGNCKRNGGRMVPQHLCSRDTCCHVAGGNPFLTTGRKCAQRRGKSLPHTFCHGGAGREVCCRVAGLKLPGAPGRSSGPAYIITTKLKCRTGRGADVDERECNKRGKYSSREVCCRTQVRLLGRTGPATYKRIPHNECRPPMSYRVADRECTPEVDGNREVCCQPVGDLTNLSTARRGPYLTKKRLCYQARGKVVARAKCGS